MHDRGGGAADGGGVGAVGDGAEGTLRSASRWLMLSTVVAGGLNYGYTLVLLRLLDKVFLFFDMGHIF